LLLLVLPAFRGSVLKWPLLLPLAAAIFCLAILIWGYRWPHTLKLMFWLIPIAVGARFLFSVFLEFRTQLLGRQWRFRVVAFVVAGFCIATMNFVSFLFNLMADSVPIELVRPENMILLMILTGLIYFIPSAP
jgi:hypothetical protein